MSAAVIGPAVRPAAAKGGLRRKTVGSKTGVSAAPATPAPAAPVCDEPVESTAALAADSPRPDAAFSAVVQAPGIAPFVVWSKRPLADAAADALTDAVRCLNGSPAAPISAPEIKRPREAYHEKASL